MLQSMFFLPTIFEEVFILKVVYPVCYGVDVHKSFFIATIISTTSDIQPNYSRKRFSTFNNDIVRFADWLSLQEFI